MGNYMAFNFCTAKAMDNLKIPKYFLCLWAFTNDSLSLCLDWLDHTM
jgi:hypothetical protein